MKQSFFKIPDDNFEMHTKVNTLRWNLKLIDLVADILEFLFHFQTNSTIGASFLTKAIIEEQLRNLLNPKFPIYTRKLMWQQGALSQCVACYCSKKIFIGNFETVRLVKIVQSYRIQDPRILHL